LLSPNDDSMGRGSVRARSRETKGRFDRGHVMSSILARLSRRTRALFFAILVVGGVSWACWLRPIDARRVGTRVPSHGDCREGNRSRWSIRAPRPRLGSPGVRTGEGSGPVARKEYRARRGTGDEFELACAREHPLPPGLPGWCCDEQGTLALAHPCCSHEPRYVTSSCRIDALSPVEQGVGDRDDVGSNGDYA